MVIAVQKATSGTAVAEVATLTHEGREFTALGSVVDHARGIVFGYVVEKDGREELQTFDGAKLGELRRVTEWREYSSAGYARRMRSYRATVDGRAYHGRMGDMTMLIRLRACKGAK